MMSIVAGYIGPRAYYLEINYAHVQCWFVFHEALRLYKCKYVLADRESLSLAGENGRLMAFPWVFYSDELMQLKQR